MNTSVELADMVSETSHKHGRSHPPLKVTLTENLALLCLKYSRIIFQQAETQTTPHSPHLAQRWIAKMKAEGVGDHSVSLHHTKHPHGGHRQPYVKLTNSG